MSIVLSNDDIQKFPALLLVQKKKKKTYNILSEIDHGPPHL